MSSAAAWTAYWRDATGAGCLPGAPDAVSSLLRDRWASFAGSLPRGARVLDLATGSGAVLRAMLAARADLDATGIDSAMLPDAPGLALTGGVDCGALPFADASFEAVTSQFGIEYCPPAALTEAMRVLADGGALQFVVHTDDSPIIRHNRLRLGALRALVDAGLLDAARRAAAGLPGSAAIAERVDAARRANVGQTIVTELPQALAQALQAPNALRRVNDIAAKAAAEIDRLNAMANVALDAAGVDTMSARLADAGAAVTAEPIGAQGEPIAWLLSGRRGSIS